MPITRVWAFYTAWRKRPPLNWVFAAFFEWGKGEAAQKQKEQGFEFSPAALQAFGKPCRENLLHPRVRKSVQEFQATEAYKEWRRKLRLRNGK